MNPKKEFINIYTENIKREGANELLQFLLSEDSDFFAAPASTRFHGSYDKGLVTHSVNVYYALRDYVSRTMYQAVYEAGCSDETIAIAALLHDICKINCYHKYMRNVKIDGIWEQVEAFEYDDKMPYGHGEKSVFMISKFMRLTDDEAYAIRFHMGFSAEGDIKNLGKAFEMYPLALALHIADMEATYYLDDKMELEIE